MSESDPTELDIDEDATVYVADPDDFLRTRKLKLITRAKDRVHDIRENKYEFREYDNFRDTEWYEVYHARLAEAVAMYGNELLPIVQGAIDDGKLPESLLEIRSEVANRRLPDVDEFITMEGQLIRENELQAPKPPVSMEYYRRIQRIERELGLGLEIEEDRGPAEL